MALAKRTERDSSSGNTVDDKQVNIVIAVAENWREKTFVVGDDQKTCN